MNSRQAFRDGKVYVPVFSFTDGVGEAFFESLGLDPNQVGELPLGDRKVNLELFRMIENSPDGVEAILSKADATLMLIRFLDQLSMNRIKEVFRLVQAETFLPKSMVVMREPKETEFKISCTYCGQKLWVRDRDAGRRGNCPQCRKTFFIPTQKAFITSFLMLTEAVPVLTATRDDVSCRNAVASLVDRIVSIEESMKSSTMRIELPPEEA
ncbi:MAG TPA: hypothetical protein PKE26_00100 [Kiritimatiellia bacterium]|nr:hypothetical protein [Kiritimatiellia bacterium]HMO97495.1 hypothetical protein [Kiritimatiellia bacterium]HMP96304.1 hypothetical protein [Kiritimatiellia bacterium]